MQSFGQPSVVAIFSQSGAHLTLIFYFLHNSLQTIRITNNQVGTYWTKQGTNRRNRGRTVERSRSPLSDAGLSSDTMYKEQLLLGLMPLGVELPSTLGVRYIRYIRSINEDNRNPNSKRCT